MAKIADSAVKIDKELLFELEEFINRKENRIMYSNKKQFVSIAVLEKLNRERRKR